MAGGSEADSDYLRFLEAVRKCPQCNSKCMLKDVRLLYASQIVVVDEELQKKVRHLESRCATLEKEGAEWRKKEHQWHRTETDLRMQVNQLRERTRYIEDLSGNSQVRPSTSFSGPHLVSKIDGQKFLHNFGLQGDLNIEGARLFDIDAVSHCIIVARRVSLMGGAQVLTKISLLPPYEKEDYSLPSGTKAIKDLQLSPYSRLVLLASLGKTLSVISTESNNAILRYDLPAAAWSCSWDYKNSHSIYAGLQNGMVLQFDMRQTSRPVQSMAGLTENPIHTLHSLSADLALGSGIKSVLSASSVGLCQWNFGGSKERPTLIPESENQGVCISVAYSPLSDNIVASFRPKIEISGDTVASQHTPFHSTPLSGQCVHGSHVFYKRIGSKYQYCGSTTANVNHIRLPKSAVIDKQNKHTLFASGDEASGNLVLQELPTFEVVQKFSIPSHPIRDLKHVDIDNSELLCCLSEDRLQLFK
ncbi:hypothetical protein Leryth_012551 [Lithospermum erythrorhizon]|nr:hypothetical protein Leryth_012551 [Lithospermum erythrorhizon]